MFVRPMSDLHLEFSYFNPTSLDPTEEAMDKETVLLLAGDIHVKYKAVRELEVNDGVYMIPSWLATLSKAFKAVVYILGNHEHYDSSIDKTLSDIKSRVKEQNLENVHVLNNESVIIDGVRILGTTLWTDFDNRSPFMMWDIKQRMSDYQYIRKHNYQSKLLPEDVLREHDFAMEFLTRELSKDWDGKTIVMSHHAPSWQSINPIYKAQNLTNGAYATNLDEFILGSDIDLWVHGHMHDVSDYSIGKCRVVCNPRGYCNSRNTGNLQFNPRMTIEL